MTPRNAGCVYLVSGLWCRSGSLRTSSGFQWQTVNIAVSAVCPQQLDMGNENYKGILNESSLFCFPAIPSKECSVLGDYILLVGPWMCYADHGMDTWVAKICEEFYGGEGGEHSVWEEWIYTLFISPDSLKFWADSPGRWTIYTWMTL